MSMDCLINSVAVEECWGEEIVLLSICIGFYIVYIRVTFSYSHQIFAIKASSRCNKTLYTNLVHHKLF